MSDLGHEFTNVAIHPISKLRGAICKLCVLTNRAQKQNYFRS